MTLSLPTIAYRAYWRRYRGHLAAFVAGIAFLWAGEVTAQNIKTRTNPNYPELTRTNTLFGSIGKEAGSDAVREALPTINRLADELEAWRRLAEKNNIVIGLEPKE